MITEKRILGNAGEELATRYLMEKGYVLLGRNVQACHHEVDIVMRDGNCLVFVEVKTRQSDWFVDPIRAVDDEKLWNLMEAAKMYKREHPECYRMEFRIDVVCVVGDARTCSQVEPTPNETAYGCRIEHYVSPFERRILAGIPWKTHYRKMRKGHYGYYRIGARVNDSCPEKTTGILQRC